MNDPGAYRRDIDGLRAVAIVAVIAFHAFPNVLPGGYIGVDVFFVISGFLITGIVVRSLETHEFSFVNFYVRRIKRIFPALCTVLAACLLFGYIALLPVEYARLSRHIIWGAGFLSNFGLWRETGYFDNAAETKPLLHLWSLGIEEQFYLVWPLILVAIHRLGKRGLLATACAIAVLSFAANVWLIRNSPDAAFYSPVARFWELLVGSLLALTRQRWAPFARDGASIAGLGLIALAAVSLDASMKFPGWLATIPVAGAALVISAGPESLANRVILSTRTAVAIGLISYPLYLWHWPLLAFERIIGSATPPVAARCAAVGMALLLAWLTYRFIELPVRHTRRRIAPHLALILTSIAGCSVIVWASNGLEARSAIATTLDNQHQLMRTPETDPGCFAFVGRTPAFPYCRLSHVGSTGTVALIGDSHAHTLFAGFAEALQERQLNLVLLANSSCPPLLGATTGDTEKEHHLCSARIEEILRVLHEHQEIRDVYFSIRGEAYVDGRLALHGTGSGNELFKTSLQATVSLLGQEGKRVHFVSDNPELSVDPVACIDRLFRPGPARCSVARSDVDAAQRQYRDDVAEITGMTIVDALPAFCDDDRCAITADGVLLYVDGHHLSVAGGRRLARTVLAKSPPENTAIASPAMPTPRH